MADFDSVAMETSTENFDNDQMIDENGYDPESIETSDGNGGSNAAAYAAAGGIGGALIVGGVVLYKKIKDGKLKEFRDDIKQRHELGKEKRETIKKIKGEMKDKIKEARHPKTEEKTKE